MGYGVMVTLQILVLPFLVRVRVAQLSEATQAGLEPGCENKKRLGYGVMVTLQILVLPFLVRVRVAQQKREANVGFSFFVYSFLLSIQI